MCLRGVSSIIHYGVTVDQEVAGHPLIGSLVVQSLELIGQDTKPQVAPDKFIGVCMSARKHSDTEGGASVWMGE